MKKYWFLLLTLFYITHNSFGQFQHLNPSPYQNTIITLDRNQILRKDCFEILKKEKIPFLIKWQNDNQNNQLIKFKYNKYSLEGFLDTALEGTNLFYYYQEKDIVIHYNWNWIKHPSDKTISINMKNYINTYQEYADWLKEVYKPLNIFKAKISVKALNNEIQITGHSIIVNYLNQISTSIISAHKIENLAQTSLSHISLVTKDITLPQTTLSIHEWLILISQMQKWQTTSIPQTGAFSETLSMKEKDCPQDLIKKAEQATKTSFMINNKNELFFISNEISKKSSFLLNSIKAYQVKSITTEFPAKFLLKNIKDTVVPESWEFPENQIFYYPFSETLVVCAHPKVIIQIDQYFIKKCYLQ